MSKRQRRRQRKHRRHEHHSPTKRQLAAGAGLTVGATLAGGTAQAADFTVTNLADSGPGSLRQAIDDANANPGNDRVLFASGLSGTIALNSELFIGDATEILGPGAAQITVGGGGTNRVFSIYPNAYGDPGDPVAISGLTIANGYGNSVNGGAISSSNADLSLSAAVVSGNRTTDEGAGIFAYSGFYPGSLTIRDSTISGNTAGSDAGGNESGGGVFASTPTVIDSSTISGNHGYNGAGIFSPYNFFGYTAPLTVRNSTISGNFTPEVGNSGGGIWFCCGENDESVSLESSTISGNRAFRAGGVYTYTDFATDPPAAAQINNTIIANNSVTDSFGPDLYANNGATVSFSLIENTSTTTGSGASLNQTGPNIFGVDPQLGPLASNGGPTATHALPKTSPAVDKGNTGLASDQRGRGRPFDFSDVGNAAGGNGADIGAFELGPPCKGAEATIFSRPGQTTVGTPGPDVIVGTSGADRIVAGAGNDVICALGGRDRVAGQVGADNADGGGGKDRMSGGAGKDRLSGKGGADRASGGKGKDRINGGEAKDRLNGGKGKDRLNGGKGRDRLSGGPKADRLKGGPKADRLIGGGGADRLIGGGGVDTLIGGPGKDKTKQ